MILAPHGLARPGDAAPPAAPVARRRGTPQRRRAGYSGGAGSAPRLHDIAGGMTTARAFWTTAPGRGELRAEHLAVPDARSRLVRTLASGVSRGTEALVFAGRVPPSQYAGDARAADGRRVSVPGEIRLQRRRPRRRTAGACFVLHPHQDRFIAPAAMCIPVPDACPTQRAVLAANMETALNLLWDAAPLPGERMLVVGAGVVGLLAASLLARIPAAAVTVVDIDPARAGAGAGVRLRLRAARRGAGGAGTDRACLGAPKPGCAWPGPRRVRGADRRGKLVRRRRARGAAGRGVPRAPAAADRAARSARSRRPMRGRRSHAERLATGARAAGRSGLSTRCWRVRRGSPICRRRCRAILRPGGLCHVITLWDGFDVQPDRLRPHHDRAQFPGRGIRPGAAPARRDLRGRGGVPRADTRSAQLLVDIGLAKTELRRVLERSITATWTKIRRSRGSTRQRNRWRVHIHTLIAAACREGALGEGGRGVTGLKILLRESAERLGGV